MSLMKSRYLLNFFVMNCFAGEGNIGHMAEQVRRWGFNTPEGAVTDEQ